MGAPGPPRGTGRTKALRSPPRSMSSAPQLNQRKATLTPSISKVRTPSGSDSGSRNHYGTTSFDHPGPILESISPLAAVLRATYSRVMLLSPMNSRAHEANLGTETENKYQNSRKSDGDSVFEMSTTKLDHSRRLGYLSDPWRIYPRCTILFICPAPCDACSFSLKLALGPHKPRRSTHRPDVGGGRGP